MKRLLFLLFVVLTVTVTVSAQKGDKFEKMAQKQTNEWIKVCELSNEQAIQLKAILLAKSKEMNQLKNQHGDNKEVYKAAKKTVAKKYATQIEAVVGTDNAEKMKAYRKSQKQNSGQ